MADISFATINVVDGVESANTPQLQVISPSKHSARPGDTLVVFLDLPMAPVTMCNEVIKTLSLAYWGAPGGVTTALKLAIKLANDRLLELNRGVPQPQRAEGSITCVVATDDSLVIAQGGPALAYARNAKGGFESIMPMDASTLIGVSKSLDVYFTNLSPRQGDVLVLTGSGSCVNIAQRMVEVCMGKGDARMVAGYLNANIKQGKLVGVSVSVGATSPIEKIVSPPDSETARSASRPVSVVRPVPIDDQDQNVPVQSAMASSRRTTARQPIAQVQGEPEVSGPVIPAAVSETLNNASRSIKRGLSVFGGQLLPQPTSASIAQASQGGRASIFVLAVIAILIPILVAAVGVPLYLQYTGEVERQRLKTEAQTAVELARQSKDPTAVRVNWPNASLAIQHYLEKNPTDVGFEDARKQAQQELDRVNKVTRVPVAVIATMTSGAHRIAASAFALYVIDTTNGTGQYMVLNQGRTGVQGKPVNMAFRNGQGAGVAFADVAWASTLNNRWRSEGAVVFATNGVYEYLQLNGQLNGLSLPTEALTEVVRTGAGELYNNTLYLLDTGIGQIWRFQLQGDALVKGSPYFGSPFKTLQDSIDMSIDGAIYVLQRNGAVLKYFNRQPQAFTLNNLPDAIGPVSAIAVTGADISTGSIYLADNSGALFEFSKNGDFIRQFRGNNNDFQGAQDISVDGTNNVIYVATPERVLSFKLP